MDSPIRWGWGTASLGNEQHAGARVEQQDYFAIDLHPDGRPRVLLVLADGMGGHEGGAAASVLAVDAFVRVYQERGRNADDATLWACLEAANAAVITHARSAGSDMGTTLVAACVDAEELRWLSVGDSLVLSCNGAHVTRLNRDHTLGEKREHAAERGDLAPDPLRARLSPSAPLTSYLGLEDLPQVDLSPPRPTCPGECLVLASDGLTDALTLDEVGAIVDAAPDAQAAAEALVDAVLALRRPHQDNVSVVVLKLGGPGRG